MSYFFRTSAEQCESESVEDGHVGETQWSIESLNKKKRKSDVTQDECGEWKVESPKSTVQSSKLLSRLGTNQSSTKIFSFSCCGRHISDLLSLASPNLSPDNHSEAHLLLDFLLLPVRSYTKLRPMSCLKTTRELPLLMRLLLLLQVLPAANAFSFTSSARSSVGALRNTAVVSSTIPHYHHHQYHQQNKKLRRRRGGASSLEAIGVTSSVIETVAQSILKLALANPKQATVECTISSSAMDLVRGNLERAKVDG